MSATETAARSERRFVPAGGNGRRGGGDGLLDHEELVVGRGERSGAYLVIAVHSTALGPSLGGARLWHYPCLGDGIADALRLSEAMTYKASAAGLDLGGGKAVLCAPSGGKPDPELRRALMLDLGDAVEGLEGRYITAEDVGTSVEDIAMVGERTDNVTGKPVELGGSGDPSPITARGVEAAIRACCRHRYGSAELSGRRIAVVGLGHVGARLAERLATGGAELVASDIDEGKREIAERLGGRWVDPDDAMAVECELLVPCALGGAIDAETVETLRCEIVCGAANNVLARDGLAERLAEREILYAPDFIANAGGLINVYGELHGLDPEGLGALVDGIGPALGRILEASAERSVTPLRAARELALERLEAAREGDWIASAVPGGSPRARLAA
jgi:leucine dehydrogenase